MRRRAKVLLDAVVLVVGISIMLFGLWRLTDGRGWGLYQLLLGLALAYSSVRTLMRRNAPADEYIDPGVDPSGERRAFVISVGFLAVGITFSFIGLYALRDGNEIDGALALIGALAGLSLGALGVVGISIARWRRRTH